MKWSWKWLEAMPSTNLRIFVTIVLAMATGVRVLFDWEPPTEWLLFLSAWAGIDTLQFAAKRVTHKGGSDAPPAA